MFAALKERFGALTEFNSVRGLRWGLSRQAMVLLGFGWVNALVQSLLFTVLYYTHARTDLWVPAILLGLMAVTSVLVVTFSLAVNLFKNIPQVIGFLRDPTFENE